MNYCIMRCFWSKELATILSKLLTITVAFYVLYCLNKRTKYLIGEEGHGLNKNTLLFWENFLSSDRNVKKKSGESAIKFFE